MRKIWNLLTNHIRQDFNYPHYIFTALFLTICICLNYKYNFYDDVLRQQEGIFRLLCYFTFYASAYCFSILSYIIFYKKYDIIQNKTFWIKSLLVLLVLGWDNGLPYLSTLVSRNLDIDIIIWVYKVLNNFSSLVTVMLPLFLYYYYYCERSENHYYGLRANQIDVKPYFTILLIVLPLIIGASFHESFTTQYPTYPATTAHTYLGVPEWLTIFIYEISYSFDFISVELLFRGFLVIGMLTFMGRSAVLSMAVVYCFLHFGKPPGEAISSIFGGYVLGVIAYETKSIWGGIIIHLGVAWTMELSAFIQKYF